MVGLQPSRRRMKMYRHDVSLPCSQVNRSGISNLTGLAGAANIQGEDQKKLDVVSNTVFCNALRASGRTVSATRRQDLPEGRTCPILKPDVVSTKPCPAKRCATLAGW